MAWPNKERRASEGEPNVSWLPSSGRMQYGGCESILQAVQYNESKRCHMCSMAEVVS